MLASALILAYLAGFATPFVWFAVDARRGKKPKRGAWFE